ncbi:MAG: ComEC/Rec2 family competence protein [Hyphomicrobium sp.]
MYGGDDSDRFDAEGRLRGMPQRSHVAGALQAAIDVERGRFLLWAPLVFGAGILAYFSLANEPSGTAAAALVASLVAIRVALRQTTYAAIVASIMLVAALGFAGAKLRVETVRAPVLEKPMRQVALTGIVERVEPGAKRGARLTIAVETFAARDGRAALIAPHRVRVRVLSQPTAIVPGDRVTLSATLAPPATPAYPGGFDFARTAWFERIGAVGYAIKPATIIGRGVDPSFSASWRRRIASVRHAISERIRAALPGEVGAIATALITGERGGITDATNEAFKNSGLFHILSISGLHMVVMAGAVFQLVRLLLALSPAIALNYEIKKWAAVAGLVGAGAYLAISGGAFATVRSAIMIAIMFMAILLDRPALALRNVALAALVILVLFPESLFDAGFQMSFAAVTALVAVYEEVRRRFGQRGERHVILKTAMFFGGIVLSTLIASAAVAPFAAYHFHQSQQYAVIANLLAIPVCNFIVMPAALLALLLMPFGLEALALYPMGLGIEAMRWCANLVAQLPGAVGHLPAMPTVAFALMVIGGLWLALVRQQVRVFGIAAIIAGLALAPTLRRPDILVARSGALVAVRGADGNLSALPEHGGRYELQKWLEHDGDARDVAVVEKSERFVCDGVGCIANVNGVTLAVARHAAAIADDCARADIVILAVPKAGVCAGRPRVVIDVFDIWDSGVHALYVTANARDVSAGAADGGTGDGGSSAVAGHDAVRSAIRIETVAAYRGDRPWSALTPAAAKRRQARVREAALPNPRIIERARDQGANPSPKTSPKAGPSRRTDEKPPLRPEIEDDFQSFDGESDPMAE